MFVAKCSLPGKNNFNPTQLQRQSLLWSCRKVVQKLQPHQILYSCWGMKRNNFIPKVTWGILREYPPYNLSKRKCYVSLKEKLEINSYKRNNLLNKRSELIKYRLKLQARKQIFVITTC